MLKIYSNIFMDDDVEIKPTCSKKSLLRYGKKLKYYAICIATNPENLLDIIRFGELEFNYYKERKMYIIGVASSKENARYLVADIIQKVYNESNGFNCREFFEKEMFR